GLYSLEGVETALADCREPYCDYSRPYPTNVWKRWSRVVSASVHRPGCTAESWSTVLRLAVSQRKRSAGGSMPIGPPSRSPRHIFRNASNNNPSSSTSYKGQKTRNFSAGNAYRISKIGRAHV